ncbi:hypothetical protein [Noviherbaspirillum aridicola]|uniref:Homeodomain-like domain-containing protein n=1 Tax=Noviherbaspirillum aridicola TaxID=2849687 RepID=A0ABQ4Q3I2_9BURK|nr:hypothetical protein [Noviherbaspirillum aridicola]GIZ51738.1 hypothetical protein NCCP691_17520 [Noviherbaspirillum aridicola]
MNLTKEHEQYLDWVRIQVCLVKSGHKTLAQVSEKYRACARRELEAEGYRESAKAPSLVLQWQREDRERAKQRMHELRAAGCEMYSPGQDVFTAVVREHLDGCEAGTYPTARATAEAVAGINAHKLLAKTSKKRMKQAFRDNKDHSAMKSICTVADYSTLTAVASGSVSSYLGALANSHKLARRLERIESKAAELDAELTAVRAEAVRANARLGLKDQGKDWKERARTILAADPGISNRKLGERVGVHESTIRKYRTDLTT